MSCMERHEVRSDWNRKVALNVVFIVVNFWNFCEVLVYIKEISVLNFKTLSHSKTILRGDIQCRLELPLPSWNDPIHDLVVDLAKVKNHLPRSMKLDLSDNQRNLTFWKQGCIFYIRIPIPLKNHVLSLSHKMKIFKV